MQITNNKKLFRFEALMPGGEYAFITYRWLKGSMVIMHTFVPPSGRGKGAGAELAKYVLDHARTQNLKVIVYCPFVDKYIKQHPGYNNLLQTSDNSTNAGKQTAN